MTGSVTELLDRMADGDDDARRTVLGLFYDPMRRVARSLLRSEPVDSSLQATELVHETVITRLSGVLPQVTGRDHFLSLTTRAMWQTVIDRARRRATRRRHAQTPPDTTKALSPELSLSIRNELRSLSRLDPTAARIVTCRDLEHKTWAETAEAVGVNIGKAREDYAFAISWLRDRLRR